MKDKKVVFTDSQGNRNTIIAEDRAELSGIYKGLLDEALAGRIKGFEEVEL